MRERPANALSCPGGTAPMTAEAAPRGAVSLADVLAMPAVRRGLPDVLVGEHDLDRPVRWAHVVELPAPERLLRGGELVLSTGVALPAEERGRRRWVARVAEQGAAALAVELGLAFRERLPRELVAACRAHDLPLVAFRRRVAFVEITRAIHSAIVDYDGTLANDADAIQERVVDLLLGRHDLQSVLESIADELRVPVALEDGEGELVCCAEGGHDPAAVARAFGDFRRYGSRAGADAGAAVVAVDEQGGRIVALGMERSLTDFQRLALRRSGRAIALGRASARERQLLRAASRGRLLSDLMAGRLTPADAAQRAQLLGFAPPDGRLIALAARRRAAGTPEADELWWSGLAGALRDRAAAAGLTALFGVSDGALLGLVAAGPGERQRPRLADVVHEVAGAGGGPAAAPVLVLGETSDGLAGAGAALRRAVARAGAVRALPARRWHDAQATDILDLLHGVRDSDSLREFVRAQLGPLLDDGSHRTTALLETLEVFVAQGGRKAATARALHLDRASLYPRLRRIEQILHVDLEDPLVLTGLHAALEARAFVGGLERGTRLG